MTTRTDPVSATHPAAAPARPAKGRRLDVEGLRGVAILLVVVFHIWFGTVSGGVDAFLFISGFFLIPSLLRAQVSEDPVNNPFPRLWRVLKRLWIPMAATVAAIVLAAWYVYPYTRRPEMLIDAVWSDLWMVNWTFAYEGRAYTDAVALPSPFQHLWSLAVQAQIFVLLIVGIGLIGLALRLLGRVVDWLTAARIRAILIAVVVAVSVASFVYAGFIGSADPAVNYYNTFSRFWEISLGGVLGLILTGRTLPAWFRQLAGVAGLAMLVMTGFVLDGAATFPGYQALLPLGGTILVFAAGTGGSSLVSRGLSTRPVVYLGTVAYYLYLVHWPILVMYMIYRKYHAQEPVHRVGLVAGLLIIAVSLLLSAGFHFVFRADSPVLRWRIRTPAVLAATAVALTVSVQAWATPAAIVIPTDVDPDRFPGASALADGRSVPDDVGFIPNLESARMDLPDTAPGRCYNDGSSNSDLVTCDFGAPRQPGRKVLTVVGGSHADHFVGALDEIGKRHGFTVETVIMLSCRVADGPTADGSTEKQICRDWQVKAMDHLLETRPDAVFTNSTRDGEGAGEPDQTPQFYVDAFSRLSQAGIPVVGVRDLPWLKDRYGEVRDPIDCFAVRNDPEFCGADRASTLAPQDPAIDAVGHLPDVHLLDFTDLQCTATHCPLIVGNVVVYRDAHHYTRTFVMSLVPYLEEQMMAALGWPDQPVADRTR
ncbi:putative acyltransferase [Gordonia hirsuta DSM 44140 = NBRC 16056]|uniref:Putative acyltransferase n=1 Tax=Gordonia hirsuta DSM 44140 = NBRC 16056 TaxID=1121927 RepID=L7LEM4_9ACTN|nr:acyltransferase family protein [Gordonia hirsuta]GAC58517.1 putative acyltransferase [Gordonia hirsuta DSM 44140 = NBRC 16056]